MWVRVPPAASHHFNMAAQRKKHTEAQLSGFYRFNQIKDCPACSKRSFKVIESRKTFDGTRRRYECTSCDFRQTMYEIPSECYEELRVLRSKFALIRNAVFEAEPKPQIPLKSDEATVVSVEVDEIPCCDCVHLTPNGCSFDIPEAQTEDAKGCNLFQALV